MVGDRVDIHLEIEAVLNPDGTCPCALKTTASLATPTLPPWWGAARINRLALPARFDSGEEFFAKILGDERNGYWRIAPAESASQVGETRRRYRDDSLVLETEFETADAVVRVVDCMPVRQAHLRGGAHGGVHAGTDRHAHGPCHALRLWIRRALGQTVLASYGHRRTGCFEPWVPPMLR